MKAFRELIEDLQKDEALAAKFSEAVNAKAEDAGKEEDPFGAIAEIAAEFGYEADPEELKELAVEQQENLSEEELGKVAGGSSPFCIATASVLTTLVSAVSVSKIID